MAFQYDLDQGVDRAGTFSVKWDCLPAGAPLPRISSTFWPIT